MSNDERSVLFRQANIAAGVAGILSLIIYIVTVAPELPPGHDSAELIAAAAYGGIAHPPGYPLYTMLGHIAVLLSPWEPIFTLNLFSAFCGALAVTLAAWAFSVFSRYSWAGGMAALMFGLATTPWRLSVGAEVFAMHLAFIAALFALAAWWQVAPEARRPFIVGAGAAVFGLACSHHHTIVLMLLPLGLFFWAEHRRSPKLSLGFSWWVIPLFLLGLTPYLYLPWKAAQHPLLNWGDPSSLKNFLWVVLRQGYGGTQLSTASHHESALLYHLGQWCLSLAWLQFPVIGFILGVLGIFKSWKEHRSELGLFASVWLLYGPIWCVISDQPSGAGYVDMLERFYAASYLGFAGLIALGIAGTSAKRLLCNPANRSSGSPANRSSGSPADRLSGSPANRSLGSSANRVPSSPAYRTSDRSPQRFIEKFGLGAFIALFAVSIGGGLNWGRSSASKVYIISDSVAAMVNSVPSGALFISCNDLTSGAFMYATAVEGRDMIHVPAGLAYSEWFRAQLDPKMAEAIAQGGLEELVISQRQAGRAVLCEAPLPRVRGVFFPYGLVYRYYAPGEALPNSLQAALESLMYLNHCQRRSTNLYSYPHPFWVDFYEQRWRTAFSVLNKYFPKVPIPGAAYEKKEELPK
ncbi:DUF2723 domain-containing protein [bacterium]|nr:DUF2723 domain-containing protein [bacterium]